MLALLFLDLLCADKDLVSSVAWTPSNLLYSCSDDSTIQSWTIDGEADAKLCDLPPDTFGTCMDYCPSATATQSSDLLALGCSDGL